MARPATNIVNQLGVETVYGTGVNAAKKLVSTGFDFSPEAQTRWFRRPGSKYLTSGVKNREWTLGSFNGILSFNEIVYILAGLFGHGTVTQIGATGAYTWPIAPNPASADSWKSYTLQKGDAAAAEEVNGGAFRSLTIDFAEESIDISGDLIGRTIDDTVSLDTVTDEINESPAAVSDIDWYINDTYAAIGTTQWIDVFSASFSIPSRLSPKVVQNTTFKSIRELVEVAIEDLRLTIRAENNAQTRSILTAIKADSLPFRFIQCKIIGDNIGVGADYTFKQNMAVKYESDRNIDDLQSTYAKEINFRCLYNETMNRALEFTIINQLAAL